MYNRPIKLLLTTNSWLDLGKLADSRNITRSEMARHCVQYCLTNGIQFPDVGPVEEIAYQYEHVKKTNDSGKMAYYIGAPPALKSTLEQMVANSKLVKIKYLDKHTGYVVVGHPLLNTLIPKLRFRLKLAPQLNIDDCLRAIIAAAHNPPAVGTLPIEGYDPVKALNYVLNNTYATRELIARAIGRPEWVVCQILKDLVLDKKLMVFKMQGVKDEVYTKHPGYEPAAQPSK